MAKAPKRAGVDAASRIREDVADAMRGVIAQHAGNEVLFVADTDDEGVIVSIRDLAHGSPGVVAVPRKSLQRGQVVIHNHPSGRLVPSEADVRVASALAEEGIGSWIVDNQVSSVYVLVEAYRGDEIVPLDADELVGFLGESGAFAKAIPGFMPRQSQIDMMRLVAQSFNNDEIAVVEAGTGVGKTFAYLLPAMFWAFHNKERVVISTATINLQQQIIDKDIPIVAKILGLPIKSVLAKGRSNYLCLKRLQEATAEDGLLLEEDSDLSRVAEWAKVTKEGSRSDLEFMPNPETWLRVNADADNCPGAQCGLRERCFFFRARREATSAHVIVSNHALLFADAALRASGLGFDGNVVLPAFQRLIFDEAHAIEAVATDYFLSVLNRWTVLKYLNLLIRRRKGRDFGVLPSLVARLESIPALALEDGKRIKEWEDRAADVRALMFELEARCLELLGQETNFRLEPSVKPLLDGFIDALIRFQQKLLQLIGALEALAKQLDEAFPEEDIPGLGDLAVLTRRLASLSAACETFRQYEELDERVVWIQRKRGTGGETYPEISACPLDLAPRLRESIFDPYPSVVLCSATLTVNQSFQWWAGRLGLGFKEVQQSRHEDEWGGYDSGWHDDVPPVVADDLDDHPGTRVELAYLQRSMVHARLPSPFDYENRVLLCVPQDAPEPKHADFALWLADTVLAALRISEGRALVLFTSYELLRSVADRLEAPLATLGYPVLRQGQDDKARLLSRFRTDVASVLFATDSFWEGVDAPGETLQLVILTRLPFRVPSDPLQLAKSELLERRGKNPFFELSVPEAVMKFRQGFGRLMRRLDDFGAVLVCDQRILSKGYGRTFLNSLPVTRRAFKDSERALMQLSDFFEEVRSKR